MNLKLVLKIKNRIRKVIAYVVLAIFLQAITTHLLHSYLHHSEPIARCESNNEKHFHDQEFAGHHCQLCDFTFSTLQLIDFVPFKIFHLDRIVFSQKQFHFKTRIGAFGTIIQFLLRGPPVI